MSNDRHAARAFKILTAEQWAAWQSSGHFAGAPIDLSDGFIHLSAADQVAGTLEKHFAGQSGLILAEIELVRLGDAVKWEPSRGGALFPHVYAPIPLSAVLSARPMNAGDYSPARTS
jgi:beta-hydroxylase